VTWSGALEFGPWLANLLPVFRNLRPARLDSFPREAEITLMRRLILLRHAKTERAEPGERDRDRKLVKRGRADVSVIGAYMANHGLLPDLAIVSPAKRTQETWTLLAAAFAKVPRMVADDRLYSASSEKLIGVIGETRKAQCLLVVGHNPGLHDLAVQLIASGNVEARERLSEKLPTSGLVVIDLPFDDWPLLHPQVGRLERFISPREIIPTTE
jgi:phosphohistidine phosphatase